MKKLTLFTIAILSLLAFQVNALIITNGPLANTSAPDNETALKCWNWVAEGWSAKDKTPLPCTAVGYRVFCAVTTTQPIKQVTYKGEDGQLVTNVVEKYVDSRDRGIRFLIMKDPLLSWAPVATDTPTGISNEFPILVVSYGVGCKSSDGTSCDVVNGKWLWGSDNMKSWGSAQGVRVGPGIYVNWKMGGDNACQAGPGDRGGGTFNAAGEFLGPISAFSNPTTKTSWSASIFVKPALHLVDEYLRPPVITNP